MSDKNNDRVMHDKDVVGGSSRREVDHWLSEKLGGYKSEQAKRGETRYYSLCILVQLV